MCLKTLIERILPISFCLLAVSVAASQTRQRNNPYTPSPVAMATTASINKDKTSYAHPQTAAAANADRSVAHSATDIYRIGTGDVIFIDIKNSANGKGYYQVRSDGSIDFPLAGEDVIVSGKTVEAVRKMLESALTLYAEPRIEVKVRDYSSHRIMVSGLVSNGGATYLRREAVPLFVICADAGVNPAATKVIVRDGKTNAINSYDLRSADTGNVVINTGDSIEFTGP